MPANPAGTANHLEERLGQKTVLAQSQTTHEGARTSEGQAERSIPLLTSWEIQRMADDDILGFHRALPPFRAKRMDWRAFPQLVRRTKIPPPQLPHLPELASVLPKRGGNTAFPEFIDLDERN